MLSGELIRADQSSQKRLREVIIGAARQRPARPAQTEKPTLGVGSSALSTQLALSLVLSSSAVIRSLDDSQRILHHSRVSHLAK